MLVNSFATASTKSILVADPDESILESIKQDPRASMIPPVTAQNGRAAQTILGNKEVKLLALVVNTQIKDTNWLSVIRFAKIYRPNLATYLVINLDEEEMIDPDELAKLGVVRTLRWPINYSNVVDMVVPNVVFFDKNETDESPEFEGSSESDSTAVQASEDKFTSVPVEDFLAGVPIFFDVFLRLSSGRFLKILNRGESFEFERLRSYAMKGASHLFVDKVAQARFVAYFEQQASKIVHSTKVNVQVKTQAAMSHGAETLKYLKSQGLSVQSLQFAYGFVKNVETLVRTTVIKNDLVKSFFQDIAKYDHAVSTSMVGGLLGNALGFQGERAIQVIGLGGLMHDIGLMKLPKDCQDEDNEALFTPEQRKIYETHPAISAQLLKDMPNIDPVVIQAVEQHHERRTRKGFPNQLGPGAINRVAEIIGICDDFTRLTTAARSGKSVNLLESMEKLFDGYSFQVTEAFRKIFFNS